MFLLTALVVKNSDIFYTIFFKHFYILYLYKKRPRLNLKGFQYQMFLYDLFLYDQDFCIICMIYVSV